MSKRIMALAAMLLAGSIGTAAAQGQMQGQKSQAQTQGQMQGSGQAQTTPGHVPVPVPGSTLPPYSQETQAAPEAPLGPNADKPKVNPSAAGIVYQGQGNATPSQGKADSGSGEHTGSVGTNANTHPLEALKARGKPSQQGMGEASGVSPTPQPTRP